MNTNLRRRIFAISAVAAAFIVAGVVLAAIPSAGDKSVTTPPNTPITITLTGTADSGAVDALAFTVQSGPSHGGLDSSTGTMTCNSATPASCTADVLYTPTAAYQGPDSFTYEVSNATDGTSLAASVDIVVDTPPVAVGDPGGSCSTGVTSGRYDVLEDTPLTVSSAAPCGLLANDTDADGDTLTASKLTDGTYGTVSVTSNGGFTYTPTADVGPQDDSFSYQVSDGLLTDTGTVLVHIIAVNEPPTFTDAGDQAVLENSGVFSLLNWATSISPGPPNESGQTVHFDAATPSNPSLFSIAPAVSASGTLGFTPATNVFGSSTVDITAVDDGGTANGGNDTSIIHTITITVTWVNQAPSFTAGANQAVNEDSGAFSLAGWATNLSAGPSNESSQTLSFIVATNDNATLFSAGPAVSSSGTLTFTPGANRNGVAHLGIEIHDSGGTANGGVDTSAAQSVTITVNPVDDPPTAVNDTTFTVPENAAATSLNVLANDTTLPDTGETMTVVAVTQGSHGVVAIAGGATAVTYKPVAFYYGSDVFTYTIRDSGGAYQSTATVALTVVKDTTAPKVTAPVQSIRTGTTMGSTTLAGRLTWSGTDTGVGIRSFLLQRSVNGGTYATLTLSSLKATSLTTSFVLGTTYRFRVRAADLNGNTSGFVYGPTFYFARYQESSTTLTYSGTWGLSSNSSYSGGFTRYTATAGRTVTFTRYARDFAFVAPTSATRGWARIYVDGVLVATVSLNSSTTLYRRVLWAKHFSTEGTHSIKVVVVGNGRVDVDCFVALR